MLLLFESFIFTFLFFFFLYFCISQAIQYNVKVVNTGILFFCISKWILPIFYYQIYFRVFVDILYQIKEVISNSRFAKNLFLIIDILFNPTFIVSWWFFSWKITLIFLLLLNQPCSIPGTNPTFMDCWTWFSSILFRISVFISSVKADRNFPFL